ncbi:MAG: redoxin domain-containing protein [Sedimentisphaerales bacterium]|nr:redoxin domain-containing protein [Sedimentisphaerales bacterium]
MKHFIIPLLISLSIISFSYAQNSTNKSGLLGKPAPAFTLQELDGKKVSLSDFKGKVVILNFWATWCPPCIKEIPDFIKLYDKYKDHGFTMIGMSVDHQGISIVKAFKQRFNINYPILMADINVSDAYGNIDNIPTTFVIDSDGIVKREYIGYRDKNVFEADIQKLLPNLNLETLANETQASKSEYVQEINKIGIAGRPESENAAPYYLKAIKMYNNEPDSLNDESKRWSKDLTTQERNLLTTWVQNNTSALEQIQLGSQKSYCWFDQKDTTIESNPYLKDIRELFLLLQARIYLQAESGKINSVISDIITLYKFGIHISNGPKPLDEKMVGIAIKGISLRAAFNILDRKILDIKSLKILEDGLKNLTTQYDEPFDIRGEKLLTQEKVNSEYSNNFYKTHLQKTLEYLDIAVTKNPWELKNDKTIPGSKTNPWIEILAPAMVGIIEVENRSKIETQALITILSILRYKNDKNVYPATLSNLILEGFLEKLPIDPFSNKPLVYSSNQQGFILYSYGADLDDDGGRHSKWGYGQEGGDQVFWPLKNNP